MRSAARQNKTGEVNLNLDGVIEVLKRQAAEKEPKIQSAQDVVDKYQDGSVIGNEEKFDVKKPKVERSVATIGKEPKELSPQDKPLPKIPKGDGEANLKGESIKSETELSFSGNRGAGTALASNNKNTKTADKAKINPPQDVVKNYSGGKDHSKSGLVRTPHDKSKDSVKVPEKGDGAFIKNEKESLVSVPKADKNAPEVPSKGELLSKETNKQNKPELVDSVKGFVSASNDVQEKAFKIAGKLIEAKKLEASRLKEKVSELSRYSLDTLNELEKSLFVTASSKKGLSDNGGFSSEVPNSDLSQSQSSDLVSQLKSLFSLEKQNKFAESSEENLKKVYRK